LHGMLSKLVISSGPVRMLADLGLKLQKDGTIKFDTTSFEKALATDPSAVNRIFSDATSGIQATVNKLVDGQTDATTGALTTRTDGLKKSITNMDDRATRMQSALDAERKRLTAQFAAMEKIVSSMTSIGTYLTNLDNARNNANK
jgi:flagellar hook-associated protein 2